MYNFTIAKPIFIKDKSLEMNFQAGFVCAFDAQKDKSYTLHITGSTYYRITLNGKFLSYGPARPPHGYLRIDSLTLPVISGKNTLAVEVAGYNCPSFYTLDVPSFLQAEITCGDEVVAATGRDFKGCALNTLREQVVPRYTYQRAFTEVYYMDSPAARWQDDIDSLADELSEVELGREYLDREFPLPEFKVTPPAKFLRTGSYTLRAVENRPLARYFVPGADVKCFNYSDCPNDVLSATDAVFTEDKDACPCTLSAGRFSEYKFPGIGSGFIRTKLTANEPSVVYIVFSEKHQNGEIAYGHGQSSLLNVIKYRLPAGEFTLESFEPYSFMYVGILVESGSVSDVEFTLREYCYPVMPAAVKTGDEILDGIMTAAWDTFRQNTVDCFTDCPGRERGGWLCDSYFTGKASLLFTGSTECERIFLDNFRLAKFPGLPDGLLPMCYPGDNLWDTSIPQWTLWYVMELYEFGLRGGDTKPFKELLERILGFFAGYENSDGLLEKLPYWNFVEWSRANNWVQDVNYPTNMLYSGVLRASAEMLDRPELAAKADHVRDEIVKQSFDGQFFRDHAVRNAAGELEVKDDRSAICQHEAIMFDIVDPESPKYAVLMDAVVNKLDRHGDLSTLPEGFERLEAFIGCAVRVEVLMKLGLYKQNLEEIKSFYGHMSKITGTLWEHSEGGESLNHGFGSYVAAEIVECLKRLRGI